MAQSHTSGRTTSQGADHYVLSVGTIEIRKNHTYLLNVWKRMLVERGPEAVPKLVIVGRRGWRVDDLMAQLKATDYLDGHVVVLESVSDAQLNGLYLGCLFTMFVSYTEGWGLPVGESLSRGKLCVASNAASVPEVGGVFPIYVDPHNVSEGKKVVEQLFDDRAFLADRTRAIVDHFVPRSWDEYAVALFDSVEDLATRRPPRKIFATELPEATWLSLGNDGTSRLDGSLACVEGWFPPEAWGRWMREREAIIEFRGKPGMSYRFLGEISIPPWLDRHGLRIFGKGVAETRIERVPPLGGLLQTTARADADGIIQLRLGFIGPTIKNPTDPRTLYMGLKRFFFYSIDDPLSYLRGLEQIVLAPLSLLA